MSKKKTEATETGLDELNDSLTNVTRRMQENKKILAIISVVVLAVIALVLAYVYFFRNPAMARANDTIGEADLELAQGNDSTALVTYKKLADDGSYDAGNRAALNASILLYQQGDKELTDCKAYQAKKSFEQALRYGDEYSVQDDVVGAAAYALQGDCLVNLDRLDEAAGKFQKAIKTSDANPAYTPYFMLKLARVYEAQKKYADQLSTLEKIKAEYPSYCGQHRVDLDAMIDLARLRSNAK